MSRRWVFSGFVILSVFALGLIHANQKAPTGLPPGVAAEMWISLTPHAGIALNPKGAPPGMPVADRDGLVVYGTLMVRAQGSWQRVYLEPAPVSRYLPVK